MNNPGDLVNVVNVLVMGQGEVRTSCVVSSVSQLDEGDVMEGVTVMVKICSQ